MLAGYAALSETRKSSLAGVSTIPAGAGMCVSGLDPYCRNATLQPATAGTGAFSRAKIDAQLTDVGWNLTDGCSVHFEYTLGDAFAMTIDITQGRYIRDAITGMIDKPEDRAKAYSQCCSARLRCR